MIRTACLCVKMTFFCQILLIKTSELLELVTEQKKLELEEIKAENFI